MNAYDLPLELYSSFFYVYLFDSAKSSWAEKRFTMQRHAFVDMDHPSISRQNLTGALTLTTKNTTADTELQLQYIVLQALFSPPSLSSLQRAYNSNLCLT